MEYQNKVVAASVKTWLNVFFERLNEGKESISVNLGIGDTIMKYGVSSKDHRTWLQSRHLNYLPFKGDVEYPVDLNLER